MPGRNKILLLDDDQDLLELYKEMLSRLPSQPEIHTATSGARAIALLESEPFNLLISDLNMPRMDGLQVLTIVRRRFSQLRTAVMTSVVDSQFRQRAYQMGIDLFLEKPNTPQEINFFMDCIESLLGKEAEKTEAVEGRLKKGLVDIIQLECLTQSSSVLKVTNGPVAGKVWFSTGEIIDAEAQDLRGEEAFKKIVAWKAGYFEILPAEPSRTRTIFNSYQSLLLECAQAIDEAAGGVPAVTDQVAEGGVPVAPESPLTALGRFNGVDYVLVIPAEVGKFEAKGVENPERLAAWVRQTSQLFRALGESVGAGFLSQVECFGPQNNLVIAPRDGRDLCIGFSPSISHELMRETMPKIVEKWVS
jgi:CheY-like chemotaxis protein